MTSSLAAGALAGVTGLLVFLILPHFWIGPIWFILPLGLMIAALGGLAVGWAYAELRPNLPGCPWTAPPVLTLNAAILLPSLVLAELRAPLNDISVPGSRLGVALGRAVGVFVVELLVTATLVGSAAGWLIGRTGRAALATALAGLVFALGPGHSLPLLGGTPGSLKGALLLLAIALVSSAVLVEVRRYLGHRNPKEHEP